MPRIRLFGLITLPLLKITEVTGSHLIPAGNWYSPSFSNKYMHGILYKAENYQIEKRNDGGVPTGDYYIEDSFKNNAGSDYTLYWKYEYHSATKKLAKLWLDLSGNFKGICLNITEFNEVKSKEFNKDGKEIILKEILINEEIFIKLKSHKSFNDCLEKEDFNIEKITQKLPQVKNFLISEGIIF